MIAGIDFSTRAVDVVLLDDDTDQAAWHRFELGTTKTPLLTRVRAVRKALPSRSWWEEQGVTNVGIEQLHSHSRGTLRALSQVQGAIYACLPAAVAVIEMADHEWKRLFTGDAKADKGDVAQVALARMADRDGIVRLSWPQDALDAFGIACACRALLDKARAA